MEDLIRLDKTFNKEMFITKVNNIFVMLYTSIMLDNLDRVRHFIGNDLEDKYEAILKEYRDKNIRKMYDELNVKNTKIVDINIDGNKVIITVELISRYMDYFVDRDTGKYISGINDRRIEKRNHLVFEKIIGAKYKHIARKCPGCNANMDVNSNGKCSYCGGIYNTEDYDWILTSLEID